MNSRSIPEAIWRSPSGEVVSCVEKLKVLRENLEEIQQLCQDALEDAVYATSASSSRCLRCSCRCSRTPAANAPDADRFSLRVNPAQRGSRRLPRMPERRQASIPVC